MITMPDSRGQKIVVLMVTRVKQPVQITEAFQIATSASELVPAPAEAAASLSDAAAKRVANAIISAASEQPGQSTAVKSFPNSASSTKPF